MDWSPALFSHETTVRTLKRLWLVVTDLHIGSIYGLLPPDFEYITNKSRIPVGQNRAQAKLWEYWQDVRFEVRQQNPDTILLLSDLTDGTNRKSPGLHRSMTELDAQIQGAEAVLKPLVVSPIEGLLRKLIAVSGSGFHASLDTSVDSNIMVRLGQREGFKGKIANLRIDGTHSKKPTHRGLDGEGQPIECSEVMVNAMHGASAAVVYLAMLLDRTSLHASAASAALGGSFPNFDLIIQGHLHRKMKLEANDRTIVLCPGFKLLEPWDPLLKFYARYAVPDIGVTWLYFYDNGDIDVRFQTFPNIPMSDALVLV